MLSEKAFELLENGTLKKGCKVKMSGITGFDIFTEIEHAFINKARPMELEDDTVVVVVNGKQYASAWIDAIEGVEL